VVDQLAGDALGEVDRNGEAEADASATAVRNRCACGVDPDQVGVAVDECAATVSGVDRSVCLDRADEVCGVALSDPDSPRETTGRFDASLALITARSVRGSLPTIVAAVVSPSLARIETVPPLPAGAIT
jgi:hypothetical protein